jgi:basic membrane protein A and related proteins
MRSARRSSCLHLALLVFTLAVVNACETQRPAAGTEAGAKTRVFRVALLTPGPISDQSWNAGAYKGLLTIRDSLPLLTSNKRVTDSISDSVAVSHIQTRTPADIEENFRQYGAQGYDMVIGHGFEFQDAAERVAPEFPKTAYITTSGNRVARNVSPIVFGFEDPSYLAGMIAGALTKTGVVGAIGGTELPPVKSSFLAFTAGAHSMRPDLQILTSFIGNWDDASAGKEQALAQIQRRADFIFQNADAAGLGVFQAARQSSGVYVFGTNSDQNAVAPDVIIASVVIDLPHAFLTVARQVRDGSFKAHVVHLGAGSEVVRLVINPKLEHLIPPTLAARLDSVRREIVDRSLHAPTHRVCRYHQDSMRTAPDRSTRHECPRACRA